MDWIIPMLPAALIALGQKYQRKDKNRIGGDDAIGRAMEKMAPFVTLALSDADAPGKLRAMRAAREALDAAISEVEAEQMGPSPSRPLPENR